MKGRTKNIYNKIKKYPVTIWMVVSILALTAVYVAYAAYNGTAEVKRVVSTQATSSTVFSSNYLETYSSDLSVKNLRTTTDGDFIVSVTVCNYDQMDFNSYAKAQIQYTFKAELVELIGVDYVPVTTVQKNGDDVKKFYVQKTLDDNNTISHTEHSLNEGDFSYQSKEELRGGASVKDSFDICFDASEVAVDVPRLFIKITAEPTTESVQLNPGISTLQSIISVSQGRSVETGWKGNLQETENEDYDGYNLIIEGSGSGTIDIVWNDNLFTMNPAFVTHYGGENGILSSAEIAEGRPEGWKMMTLTVNSIEDNRYVVQFYKKQSSAVGSGNIICDNYVPAVVEESDMEEQQEP